MTEIDRLKKELADAKAENEKLRRQLDNATFLYRQMLVEAGKQPKPSSGNGNPISN